MWPGKAEILGVGFPKKIPGFNGLSCFENVCAFSVYLIGFSHKQHVCILLHVALLHVKFAWRCMKCMCYYHAPPPYTWHIEEYRPIGGTSVHINTTWPPTLWFTQTNALQYIIWCSSLGVITASDYVSYRCIPSWTVHVHAGFEMTRSLSTIGAWSPNENPSSSHFSKSLVLNLAQDHS